MPSLVRKAKKSDRRSGSHLATLMAFSGLGVVLALGSYNAEDPSLNTLSSTWKDPKNVLGYFGSWTSDLLFQALGYSAWLIPFLLGASVIKWMNTEDRDQRPASRRDALALAILLSAATLALSILVEPSQQHHFPHAGLFGMVLAQVAVPFLGQAGSLILSALMVWVFCLLWWEELPIIIFDGLRAATKFLLINGINLGKSLIQKITTKDRAPAIAGDSLASVTSSENRVEKLLAPVTGLLEKAKAKLQRSLNVMNEAAESTETLAKTESIEEKDSEEAGHELIEAGALSKNPAIRKGEGEAETTTRARERKTRSENTTRREPSAWTLPPLGMLEGPKAKIKGPTEQQLYETAEKIRGALESFDIQGEVVEISPGPVITMYEFQPAPGVRVSKLISASTDLAMTLGVPSVRIVAPIPGKSVAGIEVPNSVKEEIVLRDVYEKTLEKAKAMKLPLVMGKDGEGTPVVEDLSRMPHLLIGGATNMGKSVLVNSLLTGLLMRFSPKELRLIVVDPKLVEFKIFEDLPHLMLPIVNDPSDASQALKWAVAETKRRYVEMQKISAKNLEAYNKKIVETDPGAKLPFILIVIDELAELMLTAKKDVEQSIVRLSQLARAAGIHLIMATQRPSADVVTGLIKSNCPSRASLRVASASDSRIIMDCSGAEQLLGKGDMFFTSTGPMGLRRMQGCYVSDEELERICNFWRAQGEPEYLEEILAPDDDANSMDFSGDDLDALFQDVLEFAKEKGKVSTSLIQRRFQIGYTRAARIMDQLEARGIVGDQAAAGKARDVIL